MKMTNNQEEILKILIKNGNDLLVGHHEESFTNNIDAKNLFCDLDHYPHAFVLACVMDRQVAAERAWEIPYKISREIGGFEFSRIKKISLKEYEEIFSKNNFHRFPAKMAECFYLAVKKIDKDYNGDASGIWKDSPASGDVVIRFLQFKGVGVKIATMAANILVRYFKVKFKDHLCIDVSPDRQVKRVFERLGLIRKDAAIEELVYCARKLYPEYPGVFDLHCWEIGRNWCAPKNPLCDQCYLNKLCPKII